MKKRIPGILSFLMCLALAALPVSDARANLTLNKVVIDFEADQKPVNSIDVVNVGDKPLKVKTTVFEAKYPGTDKYVDEPTTKIVVAPKSFELEPGATRTVRIILRKQPEDVEEYFRIAFLPDQVTYTQEQEVLEGKTIQINVTMGMAAISTAKSKNPRPDLRFERKGDVIHFTNAGNVAAKLQPIEYCTDKNDKKTCVDLLGKTIFPGTEVELQVPDVYKGKPFQQTLLINGKYSTLTYPVN